VGQSIHRSICVLGLLLIVPAVTAADLVFVGLRDDPANQTGDESVMELISYSGGVSKALGSFRVPGVVGSGSALATSDDAVAYFATAVGPTSGDGFSGAKLFRVYAGRTTRVDVLSCSDRFVKKVWTVPNKSEELYVHLGGTLSGIGEPKKDALLRYTWIDLQPITAPGEPSFAPGSGSSDDSGRVGSPGAIFEGPLGPVVKLRDYANDPISTYALPSVPPYAEAKRVDGGFLVCSPRGSVAVLARDADESAHGKKYHVFVYAQQRAQWIASVVSLPYPSAPFFLQEGVLMIPELTATDVAGHQQFLRTGKFQLVKMDTGDVRTISLKGATPIRAIGGDLIVLEPVTGKAQRLLRVTTDIESAEVLYTTTEAWWQAYCLDSSVRSESFTLSAAREMTP
jgi:hypothetical protein